MLLVPFSGYYQYQLSIESKAETIWNNETYASSREIQLIRGRLGCLHTGIVWPRSSAAMVLTKSHKCVFFLHFPPCWNTTWLPDTNANTHTYSPWDFLRGSINDSTTYMNSTHGLSPGVIERGSRSLASIHGGVCLECIRAAGLFEPIRGGGGGGGGGNVKGASLIRTVLCWHASCGAKECMSSR